LQTSSSINSSLRFLISFRSNPYTPQKIQYSPWHLDFHRVKISDSYSQCFLIDSCWWYTSKPATEAYLNLEMIVHKGFSWQSSCQPLAPRNPKISPFAHRKEILFTA
jgi:hypothetical protein